MKITAHFHRDELTTTQSGIENVPTLAAWINLTRLCCVLLEPLRELVIDGHGKIGALRINSAYRGAAVNAAIGGATKSAHMDGRAADIVPIARGITALDLMTAISNSDLPYDKCILEHRGRGLWLPTQIRHVDRKPRRVNFQSLESGRFEKFNPEDPRLERWRK